MENSDKRLDKIDDRIDREINRPGPFWWRFWWTYFTPKAIIVVGALCGLMAIISYRLESKMANNQFVVMATRDEYPKTHRWAFSAVFWLLFGGFRWYQDRPRKAITDWRDEI